MSPTFHGVASYSICVTFLMIMSALSLTTVSFPIIISAGLASGMPSFMVNLLLENYNSKNINK